MTEREIEKEAIKEIEKRYPRSVFWFPMKTSFMRVDIFGVFDFLTLNTDTGRVDFFQITTTPNRAARRNKILEWGNQHNIKSGHFWLWAWDKKEARFKIESF